MSREDDDFARQYNMGRRMDGRMGCETVMVIAMLLLLPHLAKWLRLTDLLGTR